ncbi:L-threonylcarbamoyladenylate synthase [Caldicoprobacter guelmensis]|uniref:L-threonylcarbamoyladenylate synthase n=1 Tax=Caldicoprobacter guelmensis TaxID=1170224 RepID=UPI00195E4559|nr:L-threonylcarbamoyladenylate synthase [Caldicoprobacter guelmensis]MBM7582428.1 L-threonylcarbamoyladenylate synthase [Caldicoprobacter guelmensis]
METRILRINDIDKDCGALLEAAKLIQAGELVAFPTETVYGLGANALNSGAVRKIFEAKGRPGDNPLIVHISKLQDVDRLVRELPLIATVLMERFWPGPLTLILKKSSVVPDIVTAGLDTVAIRMPRHPVALKFIEYSGVPIAAPSANRSGHTSPTTAQHVLDDLDGRIPLILDGGKCEVGLESTVLDLTADVPTILRPGGVTYEMLTQLLGEVEIDSGALKPLEGRLAKSPGMKYVHYAPRAQVVVVRGQIDEMIKKINELTQEYMEQGVTVGILATCETKDHYKEGKVLVLGSRTQPAIMASNLFSALRQFDDMGVNIVLAEWIEPKDEGLAIMNRMLRAAAFRVVDAESSTVGGGFRG